MGVFMAAAFKVVLWESDAPSGFVGSVVGFGEVEDVRVVGGGLA
jgi:hypothetical protein